MALFLRDLALATGSLALFEDQLAIVRMVRTKTAPGTPTDHQIFLENLAADVERSRELARRLGQLFPRFLEDKDVSRSERRLAFKLLHCWGEATVDVLFKFHDSEFHALVRDRAYFEALRAWVLEACRMNQTAARRILWFRFRFRLHKDLALLQEAFAQDGVSDSPTGYRKRDLRLTPRWLVRQTGLKRSDLRFTLAEETTLLELVCGLQNLCALVITEGPTCLWDAPLLETEANQDIAYYFQQFADGGSHLQAAFCLRGTSAVEPAFSRYRKAVILAAAFSVHRDQPPSILWDFLSFSLGVARTRHLKDSLATKSQSPPCG